MQNNADNTQRLSVGRGVSESQFGQTAEDNQDRGAFLYYLYPHRIFSCGNCNLNCDSNIVFYPWDLFSCFLRGYHRLSLCDDVSVFPLPASQYSTGWTRSCSYLRPRPGLRLLQEETPRQCVSAPEASVTQTVQGGNVTDSRMTQCHLKSHTAVIWRLISVKSNKGSILSG